MPLRTAGCGRLAVVVAFAAREDIVVAVAAAAAAVVAEVAAAGGKMCRFLYGWEITVAEGLMPCSGKPG